MHAGARGAVGPQTARQSEGETTAQAEAAVPCERACSGQKETKDFTGERFTNEGQNMEIERDIVIGAANLVIASAGRPVNGDRPGPYERSDTQRRGEPRW